MPSGYRVQYWNCVELSLRTRKDYPNRGDFAVRPAPCVYIHKPANFGVYDGECDFARTAVAIAVVIITAASHGQSYSAPAGIRPALRHTGASILPGGRVIVADRCRIPDRSGSFRPCGKPFGQDGRDREHRPRTNSLTLLERQKSGEWDVRQIVPRSREDQDGAGRRRVARRLHGTGVRRRARVLRVRRQFRPDQLFRYCNGERRRFIDLNQGGFDDSYSGDLALDAEREHPVCRRSGEFPRCCHRHPNSPGHRIDARRPAAVRAGALARSQTAVRHQYRHVPVSGDSRSRRETGQGDRTPVPRFRISQRGGSRRARSARRSAGRSRSPVSATPTCANRTRCASSTSQIPRAPKVEAFIRTGLPFGDKSQRRKQPVGRRWRRRTGSSSRTPRTIRSRSSTPRPTRCRPRSRSAFRAWRRCAASCRSGSAYRREVRLAAGGRGRDQCGRCDRYPGEAGARAFAGGAGFPTRVAIDGDTVFVTNARGHGVGPNIRVAAQPACGRERSRYFPLPAAGGTRGAHGGRDGGQRLSCRAPRRSVRCPAGSEARRPDRQGESHVRRSLRRHAGGRRRSANGRGWGRAASWTASGSGSASKTSTSRPTTTPSPRQWAFSDNFYADSDVSVDGHHWLVGSYPNVWTESSLMAAYGEQKKDFRLGAAPGRLLFAGSDSSVHPEDQLEGGTIWHHFTRHGVSFYNFGEGFELAGVDEDKDLEPTGARFLTNVPMPDPLYRNTSREYPGFNMNIPDQFRADAVHPRSGGEVRQGRRGTAAVPLHPPAQRPHDQGAPGRRLSLRGVVRGR